MPYLFYLAYQTWNAGQGGFYPNVTSQENDYAGSAGKPIQLLSIRAFNPDGSKITKGIVILYRARVGDRWLPWVSNAAPQWMQSVQMKYNLDGTLDTSSYDAGIAGKNMSGIEIRVFEENNTDVPPPTPTGKSKIIDAPFIAQKPKYPTGCESVATVMALNYAGVDINVESFINSFLSMKNPPFDPNESFGGNPKEEYNSYGCYAPVIKKALDKCFGQPETSIYTATQLNNVSLQKLCSDYIDNDIPVIVWATMNMATPYNGNGWYYKDRWIQWIAPEHCLLLVGYDDNYYYFNDPLKYQPLTAYRKTAVEIAYAGLGSQAIVINMDSPDVVNNVCRIKIREILSAFPMAQLYKIPDEKVLDHQFNVLRSPDLDIDVTASLAMNNFPSNLKAVYNIRNGFISLDAELGDIFLKPGISLPFANFQNNSLALGNIALKISTGKIAVSLQDIKIEGTAVTTKIAYLIETEAKLPRDKIVKFSIEVLYTVRGNRSNPPTTQAEKNAYKVMDDLEISIPSYSIDWTAVGSFFTGMAGAVNTFFAQLATGFAQLFPFLY